MKYKTRNHSKYRLLIHLIFVVKYRKPILTGDLAELVKDKVSSLSKRNAFDIEEMEVDQDHIHLMLNIEPQYSISQYVRLLKQETTNTLWINFPLLSKEFWTEKTFWSDGYFACSVGDACTETIRKYIQEQG